MRRQANQQTPAPVPEQMDLELEAENEAIESAPPAKPEKPKGGSRKGRKVRAALLPESLPVEETVIIPLTAQAAPERYRPISEEIVERLERIPGGLIVLRLVRPTFVSVDEPYAAPVTAPAPPQLLPGGFFGPQFMVDMTLGYPRRLLGACEAEVLPGREGWLSSRAAALENHQRALPHRGRGPDG